MREACELLSVTRSQSLLSIHCGKLPVPLGNVHSAIERLSPHVSLVSSVSVSKHDFVISCGGVIVSNSFLLSNFNDLRLGYKELE